MEDCSLDLVLNWGQPICFPGEGGAGVFPTAETRFLGKVKALFFVTMKSLYMSQCMRFLTMWYVRPAKPQISLRIRAV